MRIALLSDVHSNMAALEAVLAHAKGQGYEAVWHLGDVVGYGPDPDAVIARMIEERAVGVMTRRLIIESLRANQAAVPVAGVMRREFETVDIGAGLSGVYEHAKRTLNALYPVLENQRFRGVIDQNNIDEFLKIRAALAP